MQEDVPHPRHAALQMALLEGRSSLKSGVCTSDTWYDLSICKAYTDGKKIYANMLFQRSGYSRVLMQKVSFGGICIALSEALEESSKSRNLQL